MRERTLFVTVQDAIRISGRPDSTVRRWIRKKWIAAVRDGWRHLINLQGLVDFVERMKRSLSTEDAARILRVSPSTISRRIAAGQIKVWHYGRLYRIERSALVDYLTAPAKEDAV